MPTSKIKFINEKGKKVSKKFSIADSIESFLVVCDNAANLKVKAKDKKGAGNQIQPFIGIVGELTNPTEIAVLFDDIIYAAPSMLRALDVCFKIFHVFNLKYPIESKIVWQFIQHIFYEIKLKSDEINPSAILFENQLKLNGQIYEPMNS